MQIKQITYSKQLKLGLPNYSNITIGMSIIVDITEGEKSNHNAIWDEINSELKNNCDFDPSWIKSDELRKHWKYTIKIPRMEDK